MSRICKIIEAVAYSIVAIISLALNLITGGSGREFFSYRAYRKATLDGGMWRWIMLAVDAPFKILPEWTGYRSPHHCKDVAANERDSALEVLEMARRLQEAERVK